MLACETMPDEILVKFKVCECQTTKLMTTVKAWESLGIYSILMKEF